MNPKKNHFRFGLAIDCGNNQRRIRDTLRRAPEHPSRTEFAPLLVDLVARIVDLVARSVSPLDFRTDFQNLPQRAFRDQHAASIFFEKMLRRFRAKS